MSTSPCSEPASTRAAADAAVKELGWTRPYHVDADHVRIGTVERFIPHSDFFTIDVADQIGSPPEAAAIEAFIDQHRELAGTIWIPGIEQPFATTTAQVARIVGKYLAAVREAGRIYRHIAQIKGEGNFITEISMDETDSPQTSSEFLIVLVAISEEDIPLQTIAPKFSGRFNKGVDYEGDIAQFEKEFNEDLAVIAFAVKTYGLAAGLKLSVHSGSDKFSIYGPIRRAMVRFDAGLHLKTAGTSWLEEVIGLAEAGGEGLAVAKDLYTQALEHTDELCTPYQSVIAIDRHKLPTAEAVHHWTSDEFVAALRHDPGNPMFNPNLRQLLHVGYKIAARMGDRYLKALDSCEASISKNVTENLYRRHLEPLFLPASSASARPGYALSSAS